MSQRLKKVAKRAAKLEHHCHAPGCTRTVAPKMFACRDHWFALPRSFQDAIWREYRPGQEHDKKPSARYVAVQCVARAMLARHRVEFEELATDAILWRTLAVAGGFGDPFIGLPPDWFSLELLTTEELKDEVHRTEVAAAHVARFAERLAARA